MDLAAKWQDLIDNPVFQNLPYKVELNKFGQILMSPASNRKGALEVWIVDENAKVNFYTHTGKIKKSKIAESFKL